MNKRIINDLNLKTIYNNLFNGVVAYSEQAILKNGDADKDSSDIIPGHGGFLDRTDSYILTIPVVYYYLQFFVENNFLDILKGLF